MNAFNQWLVTADEWLYTYGLVVLLLGVGLYFTVRSRAVQLRRAGTMLASVASSRSGAEGGISSFQAFAVGLAARVGVGNVAGVALALVAGGPGALFWMWVVAVVGMATSFVESTLAQVFKEPSRDFSYRGGPAYYMKNGLGARRLGAVFAVLILFSVGICVVMVQANSLAAILDTTHHVPTWVTGIVLVACTGPVVLGGLRSVARVTEWMAPAMALAYVTLTVVVLVMNASTVPHVLADVVRSAFGADPALAGVGGGVLAAVVNGARRGLFSNEAGLGTVPNAAGTATVSHPVRQGLIQAFGVFVDTILVCTATGLLILTATGTYTPGVDLSSQGAVLTQEAVAEHLGTWTDWPMTVLIVVLVFSTVLGCYSYGQVNVDYLGGQLAAQRVFGLALTGATLVGAVLSLTTVWALADIALGVGAVLNLVVIVRLGPWALGALRDFDSQRRAGKDPVFVGHSNPFLPGDVVPGVWEAPAGAGRPRAGAAAETRADGAAPPTPSARP